MQQSGWSTLKQQIQVDTVGVGKAPLQTPPVWAVTEAASPQPEFALRSAGVETLL